MFSGGVEFLLVTGFGLFVGLVTIYVLNRIDVHLGEEDDEQGK